MLTDKRYRLASAHTFSCTDWAAISEAILRCNTQGLCCAGQGSCFSRRLVAL